ncbi:MAG TPA: DUF6134 family protein [Stellaceae bacterium]|nr:DUF6134 family protein [Stellaceae bacterium]
MLTYNVEHPKYGNIGTYTNTVSQNGTAANVRTDLHIAVKIIGIRMFHQDATREEQWQNQRLVSFQSTTDDNGTNINVSGKANGSNFVINSSINGNLTAPPQVHPSNPWAPFVLQTDTMMSTKTGKLTPVVVKDTGEVTATFDGRAMRVHQWFIEDDKHQVVWIDGRGVVVAFQTEEQGAAINFVLKNETVSADSPPAFATR